MDKNNEEIEDPDKHYLGNIWGWKFSFIGLGIIMFFLAIAIYQAKVKGLSIYDIGKQPAQIEEVK